MSTPEEDPFGWVGATVDGKYRVDAVVGHGGFGIVYQAHHLGFDETVALKCLKLPKELQGGDRDRFQEALVAEGRLLLQLSRATTGVVQALDVGAAVSPSKVWTPYLALEWLEGCPLDRDLAERRTTGQGGRSLGEALELLDGAARALGVAHELGIAHRDIKPANLFLVNAGARAAAAGNTKRVLKVLDFGIAKVLSESDSVTKAFEETGGTAQAFTARYGAPEQFSRRFGATGPWTDVFALGLVLIEVVLGSPALDGTDVAQLFVASSDKLVRPTLRASGFDPGDAVEAVLARALAVDPRERYPNATAFWTALASAATLDPSRLDARPPLVDAERPTREIGDDSALAVAAGTPFEPPTELSSSQGTWPGETPAPPPRRMSRLLLLVGVAGLAAASAAGAVLFMQHEGPSVAGAGLRAPSAPTALSANPTATPTPTASSQAKAAKALGVPWPGAQFRQIPAGTLEGKAVWLDTFRVVRRPGAEPGVESAFRSCSELGLSLCSESQWQLGCSAFPELGQDRSFTDSVEAGGIVERGGEGCQARRVLPLGSAGQQLGLCCERAIGMTAKNLKPQYLSSTASVLKKLENALNQHNAASLLELLDDKVKLDGVERSKAGVVALFAQTFKATPDLIVTHEACDVAVQANKVVKRSRRGRKLTSYPTNSWTASCQQVRHQRGETVPARAEYVFSPASKLRGISAMNEQATE